MDVRYDYDGFISLEKVRNAHVLLVGCGAVGCGVMLATLQTGYRRFTLVDFDRVALHNCARSAGLFHPERDEGKYKTAVLKQYAMDWDAECEVETINADIRDYGQGFFSQYDAAVCALDNYEAVDWVGECLADSGVPLYRAATNEWNSSVEIVRNTKGGACLCCNRERKADIHAESCGGQYLADVRAEKTPALEVSSAMAANRLVLSMTRDLGETRTEDVRYYDTGDRLHTFRLTRSADCSCHNKSSAKLHKVKMANRRLFNEETAMDSLNVPGYVEVRGVGKHPYREYVVTVTAISHLKNGTDGNEHVFQITAPPGYPISDAPIVSMKSPPVAHVNIFKNGNVCIGHFTPADTLASVSLRTIRVVLLDPATFNYGSKADSESEGFYQSLPDKWEQPFPLPVPKWER
ncbi:MAG: ThiF family adenylyltransferase [Clostridiales bacterium]|jgi:molybdopterin/thiamine biosynthesis adenylyltransferase/ubiquitin-protein ligase|nr:ThiF family adenylyltransferase [Clostridiales bacterium]